MVTKQVLRPLLFAVGLLAATLPAYAAVGVQIYISPPASRIETIPEQRAGYLWAPGYWDYRGSKHVWVNGYSMRQRRGYVYQPHHWVEHKGGWRLEKGRWDRESHRN